MKVRLAMMCDFEECPAIRDASIINVNPEYLENYQLDLRGDVQFIGFSFRGEYTPEQTENIFNVN